MPRLPRAITFDGLTVMNTNGNVLGQSSDSLSVAKGPVAKAAVGANALVAGSGLPSSYNLAAYLNSNNAGTVARGLRLTVLIIVLQSPAASRR